VTTILPSAPSQVIAGAEVVESEGNDETEDLEEEEVD
jgi:hypothetical protein